MAVVGLGLVINNWGFLVVLTAGVAYGLIFRINVEERALSGEPGGRYQEYAQSRKRLIPYVW